ncbi:MAG: YihA family ribosome biogenesis GTP-binding protein [Alphaproteobacteria bacterium]|nr:YihA family ribosome biogenesis GTP-binding protein [Alphaproteobacteria bacterium]
MPHRVSDVTDDFARKLFAGECKFVAGAASIEALPPSKLPEIAFVGRSNVGKSSLINALVNRRKLARVSRTPGRTRQINLFRLRDSLMIADLPGYGFAKISKAEMEAWNRLISAYLATRKSLRRVLLLLDARRGVMEADRQVMSLLDQAAIAYQALLTKADAVTKSELENVLHTGVLEIQSHPAALADVLATSVETSAGIAELRVRLAELAVHG